MRRFALVLVIVLLLASGPGVASAAVPTTEVGRIGDANFVIDMPSSWNGTLLIYEFPRPFDVRDDQDGDVR
jgi:hypothetical protein